jgi:hypothetical protein
MTRFSRSEKPKTRVVLESRAVARRFQPKMNFESITAFFAIKVGRRQD